MISEGTSKEGRMVVTKEDLASSFGSGGLPVLATPIMILLIERTAVECLMPLLKEGESTVGISVDVRHTAPSVVGSEVSCKVEVEEVDRSRIVFKIRVWDSAGEVGSGKHERFIVNDSKFMEKAASGVKT